MSYRCINFVPDHPDMMFCKYCGKSIDEHPPKNYRRAPLDTDREEIEADLVEIGHGNN